MEIKVISNRHFVNKQETCKFITTEGMLQEMGESVVAEYTFNTL